MRNENYSNTNNLAPPIGTAAGMRLSQILLIVLALLHGALILFVTHASPPGMYNSPDEAANAFFASGVAEDGHLARPVVRPELPTSVVPRGINRRSNTLIPVGFVSVPIFLGVIAKVVTTNGLPIFLAALSVLSLFAWYSFVRTLFGRALALLATVLLTLHPMLIYWGARPFMPNALFMSFVFFTLFFVGRLSRAPGAPPARGVSLQSSGIAFEKPVYALAESKRRTSSAFLGFCWGIAVALRPQEGIWLLSIPAAFLFIHMLRRRLSWTLAIISAFIPLGGLLLLQRMLYGGVLRSGYHLTSPLVSPLHLVQNLIFPFGFHIERAATVALWYLGIIIWWYAILWIAGIILGMRDTADPIQKRVQVAGLVSIALALWFLFYYGSFEFYDRFDHSVVSLGTSFTRYFLPFYAASTIPAAYALLRLRKYAGAFAVCAVIFFIAIFSVHLTVFATDESFVSILSVLRQNQEVKANMLKETPADAIILTERADKIFYPEREVITVFRNPKFDQPRFEELYPFNLYYETIADKDVVAAENQKFWEPHGLRAVSPMDLGYRHTLYKLTRIVQ